MARGKLEQTVTERVDWIELDPTIRALSIYHLRVNAAASAAISKFRNIGELVKELGSNRDVAARWKGVARTPVKAALTKLVQLRSPSGHTLDGSRERDGTRRYSEPIAFTDLKLHKLRAADAKRSIATLHMSERAMNALEAIEIRTIRDLVAATKEGLKDVRAIGTATSLEIIEALKALSKSKKAGSWVDWDVYAMNRGSAVRLAKK